MLVPLGPGFTITITIDIGRPVGPVPIIGAT